MSKPLAIRCDEIGKYFPHNATDPYHGLRIKLHSLFSRRRDDPSSEGKWAIQNVSFEVKAGGVFGVIGGNGSGKSVLLKVLARVTKPTTGRAEVYGSISSILHLGAMLVPELTGRENIYQAGTLLRLRRGVIASRFDEIVAFSGIEPHLDSLVRGYSAGMQMRLAFAVFAHLESDVLLIDEALSVADQQFRAQCMERIRRMAALGSTVVIVSHELDMMEQTCDQIAVIDRGELRALGSARQVVRDYRNLQTVAEEARHGS